jgi:hypothetical protein
MRPPATSATTIGADQKLAIRKYALAVIAAKQRNKIGITYLGECHENP